MNKKILAVFLAVLLLLIGTFSVTAAQSPVPTSSEPTDIDVYIDIENLTITSSGTKTSLTVYSEDEFDTFYSAYTAGTLDDVYVTEFVFDGVSTVKRYSLSDSYEVTVTEFDTTCINIAATGNYELSGTASDTLVMVNSNGLSGDVNLVLNGIDITSTKYTPAIMVANNDVTYDDCNVTIVPKSGTENSVIGGTLKKVSTMASDSLSGTYATYSDYYGLYTSSELNSIIFASETADEEKLSEGAPTTYYKSSGAISSDIALTFNGGGYLYIESVADEGVETKGDLIFDGGVGTYKIISQDDGINASTDGTKIYIDVDTIYVIVSEDADEGDGIDSNGYIYIEGGTVYAQAAASSSDCGIDSDNGSYINGGTVYATGNMSDEISDDSAQTFIFLEFASQQAADSTVTLKTTSGTTVMEYTSDRTFTNIALSSSEMEETTYYVYVNGTQQCYTGTGTSGPGGNPGEGDPGEGGEGGPGEGGEGGPGEGGEGGPGEGGEGGPGEGGGTPPASTGADSGSIEFTLSSTQHTFSGVQDYTGSSSTETPTESETSSTTGYIYGDVNLSGKVDITDATLIQRYLADLATLTDLQKTLAHVGTNGTDVNITDATHIQRYLALLSAPDIIGTALSE